jgi:hypothetical protein
MSSIDGIAGAAESLGGSALSELGLGSNSNELMEQMGAQFMMAIMMPMMENMAAQTQKIMKGDSSGMM